MVYEPHHAAHLKRDLEIQQKLAVSAPNGVRKMSSDEGEKFYLEYWQWEGQPASSVAGLVIPDTHNDHRGRSRRPTTSEELSHAPNSSVFPPLLPPLLVHAGAEDPSSSYYRFFAHSLYKRDFQCVNGTTSCAAIGQSDLCCPSGETCADIDGTIGCCPNGETCGGTVTGCDTANGYTSCPGSTNGGCCIPGSTCEGVGCRLILS